MVDDPKFHPIPKFLYDAMPPQVLWTINLGATIHIDSDQVVIEYTNSSDIEGVVDWQRGDFDVRKWREYAQRNGGGGPPEGEDWD